MIAKGGVATLVDLPTELVEHIASFLEAKDLCNLKLACRMLGQDVNDVYAATVFCRLPIFINSNDSLERALTIVNHVVFGRNIRKVSLYIEEFENLCSPKGQDPRIRNIDEDAWQEPDTDDETAFADGSKDMFEDINEVERTRHLRLTAILSHLQEFGKLQEVQLNDLSSSGLCPIVPEAIDKTQLMVPNSRDIKFLERVLRAMRDAHLSVPNLLLMPERWAFSSRIAGRPPFLDLFKAALQGVEHLQLHCWLLSNPFGPSYASKFMEVVASAPRLKSLTFRNAESWDTIMKHAFGGNTYNLTQTQAMHAILGLDYPRLETLRLKSGGCGTNVRILRDFIKRHETLKSVVLEDVRWAMMRFDRHLGAGETKEELAKRYFQLPGVYKVIDLGSIAIRLDFTWTKDSEETV